MKRASFNKIVIFIILSIFVGGMNPVQAQSEIILGRVKYRGGGDWYNDPSSLTNLIEFTSDLVNMNISSRYEDVALGSADLNDYPFLFLTGHGTITASRSEIDNLRDYLENGGFLYVDDDYGLDPHIRKLLKQVFPDEELIEIPFGHPIFHQLFEFNRGVPKIHEHDNKDPRAFGLFRKGRMVAFYTYESNLGDGWADAEVHNDPPEVRRQALQMGSNILIYALTH